MPTMKLVPAHDDPYNSLDLLDTDRKNEYGGPYCVAPAILAEQAKMYWQDYLRREGYIVDDNDKSTSPTNIPIKHAQCKHCGSTNVMWIRTPRGRWLLIETHNVNGKVEMLHREDGRCVLHSCPEYPGR